jgi:hypothetical protein
VLSFDAPTGALAVAVAQDANGNGLPDADTEQRLDARVEAGAWAATTPAYAIDVLDPAGGRLGALVIANAAFSLTPEVTGGAVTALGTGDIAGLVASQALMDIVRSVAGIDEEGLGELIKQAWGLDPAAALPAQLPFHVRFELRELPPPATPTAP